MQQLEDCKTVADFLRILVAAWRTRPPDVRPSGSGTKPTKDLETHLAWETEIETHVQAALQHYGHVRWMGEAWWTHSPPRVGVIVHVPIREAACLPWTVNGLPPPPAPAPPAPWTGPEKIAGHMSENKYNQ